MSPVEIKHYFIGRQGVHEKAVARDDGKISDRYIRLIGVSTPNYLDTYIQIVMWQIDNRVDISAEKRPADPRLARLHDYTLTSYKYNNEPFANLMKLVRITASGLQSLTMDELNQLTGGNAPKYFEQFRVSVVRKTHYGGTYEYYAKHEYYSDNEIFEIYKVIVLCPLFNELEKAKQHEPFRKTSTPSTGPAKPIQYYGFLFILITVLFMGCFTMWTRKRIGCTCNDGTESYATGSGACSHHDGVRYWEYEYWWDSK